MTDEIIDEIYKKFQVLLNKCEINRLDTKDVKKQQTHTTLAGKRATYSIIGSDYDTFIKYYKVLYQTYCFYFVERPKPVSYFLIDVDWWYKKGYIKREYTIDKHVIDVIKITNKILLTYFQVNKTDLLAFVHEKPVPTQKQKDNIILCKDGFHVFYPYIPLMFHHRHFILHKLEEGLSKKKTFADIHYEPESNKKAVKTGTELHGIIDHSIVMNNGVLMHGCSKEGAEPYKVTHVFNSALKTCDCETEYSENDIVDLFLNRRFDLDDCIDLKPDLSVEQLMEVKKKSSSCLGPTENKLLDEILKELKYNNYDNNDNNDDDNDNDNDNDDDNDDNDDNDDETYTGIDHSTYDKFERHHKQIPLNTPDTIEDKIPGFPNASNLINSFDQTDKDIYIAAKLCKLLSKKRASNYNSWILVCFALHNISPYLFDVFDEFSKKTSKNNYNKEECKKKWNECEANRYTLSALYKWAREDAKPEEYKKTIDNLIKPVIKKALSGTHDDIANMVYIIYRDRYKCVSFKNDVWFEFQGHRWVKIQSAYTLMENIAGNTSDEFFKLHSELARASYTDHGISRDENWNKIKEMGKIHKNLKNNGFIKSVKDCCARKFFDGKFEEKLNSDKNLLGFDNGIFDLECGKFRPGSPDDNMTFSVGYDYKEYKGNESIFDEIESYFRSIQPNKENREYMKTFIAACCHGSVDQRFHIWTGGGSNGKSATQELLKAIFGDYFGVLSVSVFTTKRSDPNSATPALSDKKGKRILFSQEPEKTDKIQSGIIKELTGGDTIVARGLFQDSFTYEPHFKLIMSCNDLPDVEARDGGTWRRIRTLPFTSCFVETEPTEPNEVKIIKHLEKRFVTWRQPLMWLLLNVYFKQHKENKFVIVEPPDVTKATNDYKKNTDIFYEFLTEHLEPVDDIEKVESINVVYQMFKNEIKENYGSSKKIPFKKDFISYLEKNYKSLLKYKKVDKLNIYGVSMILK
jgi:P4 family phage/plasmid primase-like protien